MKKKTMKTKNERRKTSVKVVDQVTGEELGLKEEELRRSGKRSVAELTRRLKETQKFLAKLNNRRLTAGDHFLCFDNVLENGYDTTGPSLWEVEDD